MKIGGGNTSIIVGLVLIVMVGFIVVLLRQTKMMKLLYIEFREFPRTAVLEQEFMLPKRLRNMPFLRIREEVTYI